jgi:hypothetical protein
MIKTNDIIALGAIYALYKVSPLLTGIGKAADAATAGGGALTSTITGEMVEPWKAEARRQYNQLIKRPLLRTASGGEPSAKRFISDDDAFAFANLIAENLQGFNNNYKAIRSAFSVTPMGANDLRMIYCMFGTRRITTLSAKSNLFSWYRQKLSKEDLAQARRFWTPTNIIPVL